MIQLLPGWCQIGGEKDVQNLFAEAGSGVETGEPLDAPRAETGLLFNLASGAEFGILARLDPPGRDLEQLGAGRMAVLTDKGDSSIGKERQRASAAGMTDNIADHLHAVRLGEAIAVDGKDRSIKKSF
jgi:hypothetical protein